MKKIHLIGLALFAALAVSAVAVASAFAVEPVWLLNGAVLTGAVKVDLANIAGTKLLIEDMKTGTDLLCSGLFEGTINSNGKDEITLVEDLEAKDVTKANEGNAETGWVDCEISAKGLCEEANGALTKVFPLGLPWKTQLLLIVVGGKEIIVDDLQGTTLGYLVECLSFGVKVDDACTGETSGEVLNVVGGVESIFNEANLEITPAVNCTIGGAKEGLQSGAGLVTPTAGGTVTVSEV